MSGGRRGLIRGLIGSKRDGKETDSTSHRDHRPVLNDAVASKVVQEMGETVTTVIISEDQKYFAAGAINKKAIVCEVITGRPIAEFTADGQITASAIGGFGSQSRLVLGTFTGMIFIYHITSNRQEHSVKFGQGEMVTCMAIGANSTRLAVAGKSVNVLLYALSLSEEAIGMNVLHTFNSESTGTLSISLDADCTTLVAGGESKIVHIWKVPDAGQIGGDFLLTEESVRPPRPSLSHRRATAADRATNHDRPTATPYPSPLAAAAQLPPSSLSRAWRAEIQEGPIEGPAA